MHVDGYVDERLRLDTTALQIDAARFDARQIQQIIDNGLQSLAIVARSKQQIRLLAGERTDGFLGTQVKGHAQRRKRRAEFVRDRGDEIVLQLVEAEKARDVLKD